MDSFFDKRNEKDYLIENFLKPHKIGITDLIRSVKDANINNPEDRQRIYTVKDNDLEKFNKIEFNNDIFSLIDKNKLKGVFFTRKTIGKGKIGQQWLKIEEYCKDKNIYFEKLITPANTPIKGYNRDKKIAEWKKIISPA